MANLNRASSTSPWIAWAVRRRIAISLVSFTLLVAYHLLVLGIAPLAPLTPNAVSISGTALVLGGLLIRSWAAGTLQKSAEVTQVGPYSLSRNPLYVGSFLMMYGFCLLLRNWEALLFVLGPMSVLYWYQVRAEERNLLNLFGDQWTSYASRTNRFIPTRVSDRIFQGWSHSQWLKNREYQACVAAIGALGILHLLNQWMVQA